MSIRIILLALKRMASIGSNGRVGQFWKGLEASKYQTTKDEIVGVYIETETGTEHTFGLNRSGFNQIMQEMSWIKKMRKE